MTSRSRPLTYRDFQLQVPTGPGLGLSFDEDKVAAFRRDSTTTTYRSAALQGA
jgi:muconate cycloisomerase